jgi:arsenate reductase
MSDVTIYHNPACSNSRGALALIRERGIEPRVIEYLKEPPDAATLRSLLKRMDTPARDLLRTKESAWTELGLDADALSDEQVIAQIVKNPRLMNRPVVVTPKGAKLCRPPELVTELLP